MKVGDKVRVTSGTLGGFAEPECNSRFNYDFDVHRGDEGVVIADAPWLMDDGAWKVVKFDLADGRTSYVACAEPDHVEVIA
jgi:hypothetical protein